MTSEDFEKQRVVLAVPPGLEIPCVRTARRETGIRFDRIAPGLIQSKERANDPRVAKLLAEAPIWTFGSFRLIARSSSLDDVYLETACRALQSTVEAAGWLGEAYWLTAPKGEEQRWADGFLKGNFGLINNPSNYTLTLRIATGDKGAYVLLGRSISVKDRFSYRDKDVVGSINPVLAACLARLLPQELSVRAIDPTCGSGTLLFERLRYSEEKSGLGIDQSVDAQRAFEANRLGINLPTHDVEFQLNDACNAESWTDCSTVICNLPFGIRLRAKTEDLDALYLGILEKARSHLAQDGRILMTSSYKRGLDKAVDAMARDFKVLSRYRAEMGGLFYQVVVLGRL